MTVQSIDEHSVPIGWPLMISVGSTGLVVAFVCVPPSSSLHSWEQLIGRATTYLLIAALVHTLAAWSSFRFLSEGKIGRTRHYVWRVIGGLWIAAVWLPLLALLTYENSVWVALFLPILATSGVLVFLWHQPDQGEDDDAFVSYLATNELFYVEDEQPFWHWLLPALLISSVFELGLGILIGGHPWMAGVLFAAGAAYIVKRRLNGFLSKKRLLHLSAGNSMTVWLLLALALAPFLAGIGAQMAGLLGMRSVHASSPPSIVATHKASSGYTGIILLRPPKPHEVYTPTRIGSTPEFGKPRSIPFDGAYWYFKEPDTRPSPSAHITHGDPLKAKIVSTDVSSLIMEAHQPLGTPIAMNCCRSLLLNLINGDARPGSITLEVVLRNTGTKKTDIVSLGDKVLVSSLVSPMPLNRAPVPETLTFQIPRSYKNRSFDEITVRIKPERNRSLAGPHISIENFVLEP